MMKTGNRHTFEGKRHRLERKRNTPEEKRHAPAAGKSHAKKVLWVFLAILLVGIVMVCRDDKKQTQSTEDRKVVSPSGPSSGKGDVSIAPVDANVQSAIYLSADKGILAKGTITWYVNDISAESVKGVRFSSSDLRRGDVVRATVVLDDREYRSNEIIVKNTPPVISSARLMPTTPKLSSRLTVEVMAEDADNDDIAYRYEWYINDRFAGDDSYLETEFHKNDIIAVEVTPFDSEAEGKGIRLKNKVYNSLPVFTESEPFFDGKVYTYHINVTDPDGDSLTYSLKEGPQGMTVDPEKGTITWEVGDGDNEEHDVRVLASDNNGGELIIPLRVKIYQSGTSENSKSE